MENKWESPGPTVLVSVSTRLKPTGSVQMNPSRVFRVHSITYEDCC